MEIDKQEAKESQIEHTLLSKQHDNKTTDDKLCLKPPPSTDVIIIDDDEDDEVTTLEPEKKKKPMLASPRDNVDAFDGLSKVVVNDVAPRADLFFSSTDHNEKKTEEKNDDVENVVESSTRNKRDAGHVSLDDLGVSVDDLKSIPYEAFDPTWEIRSWANDPWLGGYVEDMSSPQNEPDT